MAKQKTFRVVVESHVVVKATSVQHAKELSEVCIREAIEWHPLLSATSPFIFLPDFSRNSFLARKAKPVEPVAND